MFGVNLSEAAIIAVIALIVIGPERLPHYAEQLGRLVREGRRMALGLREQVREEIPEFDDVDWRQLDPRQYDPRRIVREALKDTFDDPTTAAAQKTPTRRPKPAAATTPAATGEPAPAPFDAEAT
jgi:sec-independent protein translocase protein TatB